MNDGSCKGCGMPLTGKRKDAVYCSDACRLETTRADSEVASRAFWEAIGALRQNPSGVTAEARRARQSARNGLLP
jgi:hypothetical protein